jgi:hypothetical protein
VNRAGLWLIAGLSMLIALAAAVRRLAALARVIPSGPPQMAALDQVFESHAVLTLAHIIPAIAFVLLIPFVLLRRTSRAWPSRLLFVLGALVGLTAYAMSAFAVGGWTERSAVLIFNSLFLFSLARAYLAARRGEPPTETRWLTRAIWILLGIATTRPVMAIFFATSRFTHLGPEQFFGFAFWIGFSINTVAIEIWLRKQPSLHNRL